MSKLNSIMAADDKCPSNNLINHYNLNITIGKKNYVKESNYIKEYFNKTPKNNNDCEIAAKVSIIDLTHSTQLFRKANSLVTIVERIRKIKNFDKRIKNSDLSVVDELGKGGFYSFASKYIACHSAFCYSECDKFAKYDSYARKMLAYYLNIP